MDFKSLDVIPEEPPLEFSAREASFEDDGWFCEILEVRFAGTYPHGSAGNAHARYMRTMCAAALAVLEPDVVLLDLRELAYEWGDGLVGVLEIIGDWNAEEAVGVVIASSQMCDAGLVSLLGSSGARPSAVQLDYQAALEAARRSARARSERIG